MPWPLPEHRPWEWRFYGSGGWWVMLMMVLAMILFWGIVIGGVVLVVRLILSIGKGKKSDPLKILKQRYARGEIQKDEFEQKKKDILS
jgi:putative membrane protein